MYFDPAQAPIRGSRQDNPAISVAWFAGDLEDPANLGYLDGFLRFTLDGRPLVERFLALVLQGADDTDPRILSAPVDLSAAMPVVDYILDQPIVIERSPPKSFPLKRLLGESTQIVIGAYFGSAVAPANSPLLMLVAAAGGIIVIGSAKGISTGLERGLAKKIERAFKTKK
jgi:hypothetical protein